MRPPRGPFDEAPPTLQLRVRAPLSVMAGSLVTLWPVIVGFPVLPPFGLLILLGWRLRRPDALPVWSPLPLGLFDDLLSGQPIGSAMVLWMVCVFMIDLIEQRVMLRDFWQDWLIAAGGIVTCLLLGRLFASPLVAHVDISLLVQIAVSILIYPVAASVVGWLDRRQAAA